MTRSHQIATVAVFTAAIFVSSVLLFGVQPMVGKLLLPFLGGTPAVWNLCMVFFQAVLLLGYGYAHLVARRGTPVARAIHLVVIASALAVLPIVVTADGLPTDHDPSLWLLTTLVVAVGLPFFAVSTTSPLLQSWLAQTEHPRANDPYFLYAASNTGSVIALLAYPLLVERIADVPGQAAGWRIGYIVFIVLVAAAALVTGRGRDLHTEAAGASDDAPTWRSRVHWLALAFVPSSLMLGVTTYITTDVASFPLIWVIPLALYLVSFIIVFGRTSWRPPPMMGRVMSLVALALTVALIISANHPAWLLVPMHLGMFTLAAIVLHGELAARRPPARYLTEFFLIMSLGGVLGGTFNALIAPYLFDRIWEYPLMIMAACALRRTSVAEDERGDRRFSRFVPLAVGGLALAAFGLAEALDIELNQLGVLAIFGPPAVLAYSQVEKPHRFALGGVALIIAGFFFSGVLGETRYESRNFFGVLRVTEMEGLDGRRFNVLVHGNTIHGRVDLARYKDECIPLAYFHKSGPASGIFRAFRHEELPRRVGLIGLGVGALACYGEPNEQWTYFELDPEVVRLAAETEFFGLTAHSKAEITHVMGDARIQLQRHTGPKFGMILIDAFSSDAIPVHLITQEAMQLYLERIEDGGIVAIHISNRYLDLAPVIGALAHAEGLNAYLADDSEITYDQAVEGKEPSRWVVLRRKNQPALTLPRGWVPLEDRAPTVWTDAFSDVLSMMHF